MPGELFPRDAPRPTKSTAELVLYDALKKALPDGWTAWHSLRLRVGRAWEGEGDFVLAHPGRGLLVLEVKGGRLELRDGRWHQNGKPLEKGPREQAQTFVRQLVGEVRRSGARPPPFGVACAFPDCEFSEAPDTGDLRGLVLGARDLAWLEKALPAVLDLALPEHLPPADDAWMRALHRLWGETWAPHVRLRDRVTDADRRAVALNEQQLGILDIAGENRRALVEGGAGTGKTVLARELCQRRVRAGGSATYVCFTDALARVVGSPAPDAPAFAALALRRFALDLVGGPAPQDRDGWSDVLTRAAAVAGTRVRPELVVVDEAQDFEAADWTLLEALAGDADLWVFRDPAQSFWSDRAVPDRLLEGGARLRLITQQRNPPQVAALAARYVGATPARPTSGDALRLVPTDPAQTWSVVEAEVRRLVADGARPDEIAVVSLAGQTRSDLLRLERLGEWPVVRADDDAAPSGLVGDTFLRFKGLERPFVLVTELERARDDRYDTRMHIALTRATAGCIIVADEASIAADSRLAELQGAG